MEILQTANHSQYELNKYSGVPWKNAALYENQTLSSEKLQALLLSLKAQKTQDDSWFYCKQVQEMHLRTLPETVNILRSRWQEGSTAKTLEPSLKRKLN